MKNLIYLFIVLFISSCGNEKIIQLPEVPSSTVQQVLDVSPAYLFYDESKPDQIELNRKNLISTTNWLINVDKRITLDQAIPKIIYLQNKKKNSNHKKEGVKNYYTCNDTSIKNLGFIDFTDVNYKTYADEKSFEIDKTIFALHVKINRLDDIILESFLAKTVNTKNNIAENILSDIESIINSNDFKLDANSFTVHLNFNRTLSFQDYITIKSIFKDFKAKGPIVSNNEYIY